MNAIDSFRLDVPSSWREVPLDTGSLKKTFEELDPAGMAALSPVERRRVEVFVQRLHIELGAIEARYVAVYAEVPRDVAGELDTVGLVASVVVSVIDRQSIGSDLPLSPAVIEAAMSMDRADDEGSVLAGTRTTRLTNPTTVEFATVKAVRTTALTEIRADRQETVSISSSTYFVPVPEAYEQAIVIQFSTPNIAEASVFSELFEAIAATVRFYREGEETTL